MDKFYNQFISSAKSTFDPATARRFNTPFFQPSLKVGPVDDVYEREADAVADQVMRMEDPKQIQAKISSADLQRKCSHCEEEEHLQRKVSNHDPRKTEAPSAVNDVIGSAGKPLETNTKTLMESRFGYDFSNVKIHTDANAAQSAQSIQALAYTSGNTIVFNEGQYAPGTEAGNRLLAHELTHVLQQGGGDVKRVIIDEGQPNPMEPGAYDYIGEESEYETAENECEEGIVDNDHVQQLIDEALALFAYVVDINHKLELAWSYLYQERERRCCDYDYAAAEHYMYARKEAAAGWPGWYMLGQTYGYEILKGAVPQAGFCPKTQSNWDVANWGARGTADGNLDYYGGYPPFFL